MAMQTQILCMNKKTEVKLLLELDRQKNPYFEAPYKGVEEELLESIEGQKESQHPSFLVDKTENRVDNILLA